MKKIILNSFVAILICFIVIAVFLSNNNDAVSVDNSSNYLNPTVIIDPGHGGEDGGTSNQNILEKNINLDISLILRDMLKAQGFTVKMTRDTDISIHDSNATTIAQKKRSDLNNRVKLFNSSDNNIIISIHQNNFSQSKYSGAQVFYSTNNELSKQLAEKIKTSVTSLIQPDNTREIKPAGKDIFVLNKSNNPTVLVECGFMSNPDEFKKLQNDEYRQQMAYCICLGFMEYYYTNYY